MNPKINSNFFDFEDNDTTLTKTINPLEVNVITCRIYYEKEYKRGRLTLPSDFAARLNKTHAQFSIINGNMFVTFLNENEIDKSIPTSRLDRINKLQTRSWQPYVTVPTAWFKYAKEKPNMATLIRVKNTKYMYEIIFQIEV